MADISQIGVTEKNQKCLDILKDKEYFDVDANAARFAIFVAIKKGLYIGVDLNNYGSKFSTKWHFTAIDPEGFISDYIKHSGISFENFGVTIRSLMSLGLDYLYDILEDGKDLVFKEIFDE